MTGTPTRRLQVPRDIYDGMVGHANAALPMEAVGLLGGRGAFVSRRIALPNVLGARQFLADPYAQFLALRRFAAEGIEPLAVYHSHPGGGTEPSEEDATFARRLPYLQVIIAVARPRDPAVEVAAYAVHGTAIESARIDIISS